MHARTNRPIPRLTLIVVSLLTATAARGQSTQPAATPIAPTAPPAPVVDLKYSFGSRPVPGFTRVTPDDVYDATHPYGFDLWSRAVAVDHGRDDATNSGYVTGQDGKAFFFSTKLAQGAYQVKVTLGDAVDASTTTVKSETRRLMLEAVHTGPGQIKTFTFLVHVRVPTIPGGQKVSLKPRESDPRLYVQAGDELRAFTELDWDEKLTLEFADADPALRSIEITNADHPITVYLIGDSTMTDQMMEPWTAWGQQLPRWFVPPVLIANYAECGETTASFISERRWPKVLSEIHAGDWVFMEFGINDRSIPVARFSQYFVQFIADTRAHGATPVLVTSQNLRQMTPDGKIVQSLAAQCDAMRQVAKDQNVTLIDLNNMSTQFFEALGPKDEPKAFIDGTHHSEYGAYELSKCVVQGVIDQKLPIAQFITPEWKTFAPAHPDPLKDFHLPSDPQQDPAAPGGPGIPGQTAMAAPTRGGPPPPTTIPLGGR